MTKVTVIRHAPYAYPDDFLTEEGIAQARGSRERFGERYAKVICSPANRSQQTAQHLGHTDFVVDDRVKEFEADIKALSADEYITRVHLEFADQLAVFGENLLAAIREVGPEDTLVVSHNAVMSACFLLLTGEETPFNNLSGFEVEVRQDGTVGRPTRI